MAVIETAEKILPPRLRARLSPHLRKLLSILTDRSERAASQRMALTAFAIRIVSAALAFVSQIVIARLIGNFSYGIFVFVWVLMILFGNLTCFGFHTAIIRFLPLYEDRGDFAKVRGVTRTARLFALTASTTIAALAAIILYTIGDRITGYYIIPVFLGLAAMPLIALGDILDGTARANHWPVMALSPTFLIRPTLILACMLGAIFAGAPHTAVTAMAAALLATFLTVLIQYFAVTIRLHRKFPSETRELEFRAWLAVALPIFLVEGAGYLLTNSDVVIVGFFLSPERVAVYFAAAKTMALVHFVNFAVKAAAGPRFAAITAEGNRQKLASFAQEATRWTFWPALAVGLCVFAAGHILLSLFGAGFTEGHVVMAILLVGILAKAAIGPGEILLIMGGAQMLCSALYAVTLVFNVAINTVLIRLYGIEGAAIATTAAMSLEAALLFAAVRWKFGITLFAFSRYSKFNDIKA